MRINILKILNIILPTKIFNYLKIKKQRFIICLNLFRGYYYDFKIFKKFSGTQENNTPTKLIGNIIREYHVVEKGLTMPHTRLGFGKDLVLSLCINCEKYLSVFDKEDEQLIHAISVLHEYELLHTVNNFDLDADIITAISKLTNYNIVQHTSFQKEMTKSEYFKEVQSPFSDFSGSRSSLRNFTNEEIPLSKILHALELVRNTPSACNRQSWRTYVFTDKEQINKILEVQGGNRGFGHLTNKLIVIVGEVGLYTGKAERNQVFVDGGMYAMNLLYSLHHNLIGACILNCSNTNEKNYQLRTLCQTKESEAFIAMVACGIPPDSFMIASSLRYDLKKTNCVIN